MSGIGFSGGQSSRCQLDGICEGVSNVHDQYLLWFTHLDNFAWFQSAHRNHPRLSGLADIGLHPRMCRRIGSKIWLNIMMHERMIIHDAQFLQLWYQLFRSGPQRSGISTCRRKLQSVASSSSSQKTASWTLTGLLPTELRHGINGSHKNIVLLCSR